MEVRLEILARTGDTNPDGGGQPEHQNWFEKPGVPAKSPPPGFGVDTFLRMPRVGKGARRCTPWITKGFLCILATLKIANLCAGVVHTKKGSRPLPGAPREKLKGILLNDFTASGSQLRCSHNTHTPQKTSDFEFLRAFAPILRVNYLYTTGTPFPPGPGHCSTFGCMLSVSCLVMSPPRAPAPVLTLSSFRPFYFLQCGWA